MDIGSLCRVSLKHDGTDGTAKMAVLCNGQTEQPKWPPYIMGTDGTGRWLDFLSKRSSVGMGTGEASVQVFGSSAVHLQWYQISSPGPRGHALGADSGQLTEMGRRLGEGDNLMPLQPYTHPVCPAELFNTAQVVKIGRCDTATLVPCYPEIPKICGVAVPST